MCCFCEVKNHELMWAHYADQFSRICVSYSLSKLLRCLPDDISFVCMFYDETEPRLHRNSTPNDDLARMVLSYKNHRWLYEREWRLFALAKRKVRYRDQDCVTTVRLANLRPAPQGNRAWACYVEHQTPQDDHQEILSVLRNHESSGAVSSPLTRGTPNSDCS